MSNKSKKNLIIGSLLAVLVVMTIGYAAFSTNLTINGTSNINSNWCVGFDSSQTTAYTATSGITGGKVPTGSISFSGSTCQTSYKTNASLSATFLQPGDKIVYTLTIANKGSMDAYINSVTVDNVAKTSNFTTTKGNIKFTVTMPANTELVANTGTTTMTVTAEFQNTSNLSSYTTSESQSINIGLTTSQDDERASSSSNQVYAINTGEITRGTSTLQDIGTTYGSCSETGKNVCLRYTIEDDIVAGIEACFVKSGTEYCLQSGVDECLEDPDGDCTFTGETTVFNANKSVLQTAFTETNACTGGNKSFRCNALGLSAELYSKGRAIANDGSLRCYASGGIAYCY